MSDSQSQRDNAEVASGNRCGAELYLDRIAACYSLEIQKLQILLGRKREASSGAPSAFDCSGHVPLIRTSGRCPDIRIERRAA